MENAIEEREEGCIIHVKVKIGRNKRFPAGYDDWRKRIEIEIDEEPEEGKANRAIIDFLSKYFGINKNDIEIVYGEKSREKGILIKRDKRYILDKIG